MANGTDSEEFVVLSRVRPGLKREFAFALKAQSEICGSLGRTRARKVQNGPYNGGGSSNPSSKRLKKSSESEEASSDVEKLVIEGEKVVDTEKLTSGAVRGEEGEKFEGDVENVADVTSEEEAKSDVVDAEDEQKITSGISTNENGLKSVVPLFTVGSEPESGNRDTNELGGNIATCEKGACQDETTVTDNGDGLDNKAGLVENAQVLLLSENIEEKVSSEKPSRRFTRSLLKPKKDAVEKTSAKVVANMIGGRAICNGEDRKIDNADGTLVSSATKLEMKMSKKIALKRPFSTLKDFLETGLLEGLSVKYCRSAKGPKKTQVGLRGVVKGTGIQCSCDHCKGVEVVSPTIFELHAGSSNKRPPEYICLDSGRTLRDVMNVVKDAQLDTMEEAIRAVLDSSQINKCRICLNCKGIISDERIRSSSLLCDSCLELRDSQVSPEQVASTAQASPCQVAVTTQASPAQTVVTAQASPCEATFTPQRLPKTHASGESSAGAAKFSSAQIKSWGKVTRKDLRLHKLVFEEDVLPDGTEVAYYAHGKKILVGYKKGLGIFCTCCELEVSPSQFEAHAGFASRRKPYLHIYTSNGVSLHELSISLSKTRKLSTSENDDLCSICLDGGDLLCCDTCPRAFHLECIPLPTIPNGSWSCRYCLNMHLKEKFVERNVNAWAAGRVAGTDPIEEITKRCIRIAKTPDTGVGGCALCRLSGKLPPSANIGRGFSKSGFGPKTVIICDQCEKEFHVCCLRDHKVVDLKELPEGNWFCCTDCETMHSALEKLVIQGEEMLPDSLLDVIRKKHEEKDPQNVSNLDVRWRILNRKMASDEESRRLLSKSVAVFHERFDPIAETANARDLIPAMVYGKSYKGQEFSGMFCIILLVNHSVVSAGILRIFGHAMAELPLVATSTDCQGLGYFQSLFGCIEGLLRSLNVKSLLLPAAEEAESIWINKFGFGKITLEELRELRKDHQMMIFQGTTVLRKAVPGLPDSDK